MNDPRRFADEMNTANEDIEVFNKIQFENKRIEPSRDFANGGVNKNLTMGNLKKKDFDLWSLKSMNARLIKRLPFEYGGWLADVFAEDDFNNIEFITTLSRSVEGMNQKLLVTRYTEEKTTRPEDKINTGGLMRQRR